MTVLEYEHRPGLGALFARQAGVAGSPLYSALCRAASLDLAGTGPLTDLLAPWADARAGDLVPLRVLAAAHRLVLERKAPALALWFPSAGGAAPTDAAGSIACYDAWVGTLVAAGDRLPELLAAPPQTNDVGRAAALAGVLHLVADAWDLPIRLHELGASAGLNLRADAVRLTWDGGAVGPPDSPVVLPDAWRGAPLPALTDLRVVERAGCDLAPVDLDSTDGRLGLTSFVWPDQTERLERLRASFTLASRIPVDVVRRDLVSHLEALAPRPGTALVIWHSSTWMYLDAEQRAAAETAFTVLAWRATAEAPVVHAAREFVGSRLGSDFGLVLRWWPAPPALVAQGMTAGQHVQYADSPAHGVPVEWMPPRVVGADAPAAS